LYQSRKKTATLEGSTKKVYPEPYATALVQMVDANGDFKPKDALERLKRNYEDEDHLLPEGVESEFTKGSKKEHYVKSLL
jgi:hypothetical protein